MQNSFVFISYHTNTMKHFVAQLSDELDHLNVQHWYAARDLRPMGNYADVIPSVISKCSVFLLLLNRAANESDQVKNEFQKAYELRIPILVAKMEDFKETGSFSFIRSSVQFLSLETVNQTIAIKNIYHSLITILNGNVDTSTDEIRLDTDRADNVLRFYDYREERERISIQRQFIYDFAKDTYHKVIDSYSSPTILDVGCNTGEQFMMFLKNSNREFFYIGIDKETNAISYAKSLYENDNCIFFEADVEKPDFDQFLSDIESQNNFHGFDIINISMLILHIGKPRKLLDLLRNHLSSKGKMIILDIDDGFNISYPDPHGYFQRAVNICEYTNYSGYRKSGREIFNYLKEIDMDHVELSNIGISTVGMNRQQRSDLFNIYFWFIYDDLKVMHSLYPKSNIIKTDLEWFESVYDEMKLQFKKKDFFFILGFVLFIADDA